MQAAEVGVGAPVIAYLPEHNTMVFEFLDGPHACTRRTCAATS